MAKNKIEKEYRFEIPESAFKKALPTSVAGFQLEEKYEIKISDVLFERETHSLKSEDIGMRVRKTIRDNDSKNEFTYKKFLGITQGAAQFDEQNKQLSEDEYATVVRSGLDKLDLPIIGSLTSKGKIFTLLEILNKRKVYIFSNKAAKLEIVVEQVEYKSGSKKAKDTLMEIEILREGKETDIERFVEEIKRMYETKPVNEGKNSRGMRMLGIEV